MVSVVNALSTIKEIKNIMIFFSNYVEYSWKKERENALKGYIFFLIEKCDCKKKKLNQNHFETISSIICWDKFFAYEASVCFKKHKEKIVLKKKNRNMYEFVEAFPMALKNHCGQRRGRCDERGPGWRTKWT